MEAIDFGLRVDAGLMVVGGVVLFFFKADPRNWLGAETENKL